MINRLISSKAEQVKIFLPSCDSTDLQRSINAFKLFSNVTGFGVLSSELCSRSVGSLKTNFEQ